MEGEGVKRRYNGNEKGTRQVKGERGKRKEKKQCINNGNKAGKDKGENRPRGVDKKKWEWQ